MSKLKDKRDKEFDGLIDFSEDNIIPWSMDYVNLNNNIFVIIYEARDEVIEIQK